MKKILIVIALVAFVISGVVLSVKDEDSKIETMNMHRSLVENGYVDGKFTLEKHMIDSGFGYEMFAQGDKVVLEYGGLAPKGKQFTSITLTAKEDNGNFKWSCVKDKVFINLNC